MDFHLATPTGDVYLFSYDGRQVQIPRRRRRPKPDRDLSQPSQSTPRSCLPDRCSACAVILGAGDAVQS